MPADPKLDDVVYRSADSFAADAPDARVRRQAITLGDDPAFLVYEARACTILGRPPVFGLYEGQQFAVLTESVNYDGTVERAFLRALISLANHRPAMDRIGPCCLLHNEWSRNIWHWFTEFVPKAVLLEHIGFTGTYLLPSDLSYARESLELAGIAPARIAPYTQEGLVAERLTFTQPLPGRALPRYPKLVERVRAAYLGRYDAPPPARRLYLARRGARRIVNEDELTALLDRFGFARLDPEDLSLEEQIWHASNAEIILGPHGAAMVFSLFMPPGGLVVELFAPTYVNPTVIELCSLMGHDYHMVPSRVGPPEGYAFREDVHAFLAPVEAILARWVSGGRTPMPDARAPAYRAALGAPDAPPDPPAAGAGSSRYP